MRVTYREGGALVKEWTQPAGERTVEVKGLFPGEYTVTARHESSGLETKLDFDIGLKNSLEGISRLTLTARRLAPISAAKSR